MLDILYLVLQEDSFLNPSYWLPAFELECDLVGVDGLGEV
jgi:hypothetical protein